MNSFDMEKCIRDAISKVVSENNEFTNVARPKPTRPSTATQGAWNIDKTPKASSATQGAWDATNTPGGVAARTKAVWTKDELVKAVSKAALEVLAFNNIKIKGAAKPAASKIVSGFTPSGKTSTSTSSIWNGITSPGTVSDAAKKVWTKKNECAIMQIHLGPCAEAYAVHMLLLYPDNGCPPTAQK